MDRSLMEFNAWMIPIFTVLIAGAMIGFTYVVCLIADIVEYRKKGIYKMIEKLRKFRTKFMLGKQYIHRTVTYISLINSGMILFLFLSKLKEVEIINFEIDKYFIPIFLVGFIVLLIIGWIEIRFLRGFQEESAISFEFTPQFVEMRKKIDDLWKTNQGKR